MHARLMVLLAAVAAAIAALGPPAPASGARPAWTTYRHDAARSGVDPDSSTPVAPAQAWQTPALDGEVYAQPLVYGARVYVATENDTVYSLDSATGSVVWSDHLAAPEPSSAAPCGDISPSIGITSTPVIDAASGRLYAVGAVSSGGTIHHDLFALDLGTGEVLNGFPIGVDPPYPSGGSAVNQLQRPGLALDAGRVLIGYGGNDGDCATYWGWLVSAPTDGSTALSSFQVDAGHREGAIWAAGNAPPIDGAGDAYVATGNGSGNSTADPEYAESVVKLDAKASPLDWWTPTNWQQLDAGDADLGSSMPTLLPSGYVFEAGKDGNGYVLNGGALGHVSAPAGEVSGFCGGGSFGGDVLDAANSTVYAACNSGLKALTLTSGSPPALTLKSNFSAPSAATGPPMIAGGLIWVAHASNATLYGLDPASGTTKSQFPIPESGSQVNHFASPSAGGGRLFVASGDQVTAFTIAQPPGPSPTSTSLATSPSRVAVGGAVTLTATVSPTPGGGTVSFSDGGASVSGCGAVAVSSATGTASCQASFARAGAHPLIAAYAGDAYDSPSTSATVTETVTSTAAGKRPVLSHVSLSPRRLRPGQRPILRFTLNEPARLTVAITRGHQTLQRLRLRAQAGHHATKLRFRRLATGRYTATVSATAGAGRRSRAIRLRFSVVRRHG